MNAPSWMKVTSPSRASSRPASRVLDQADRRRRPRVAADVILSIDRRQETFQWRALRQGRKQGQDALPRARQAAQVVPCGR